MSGPRRPRLYLPKQLPLPSAVRKAHDSLFSACSRRYSDRLPDFAEAWDGLASFEQKGVAMLGMAIGLQIVAFVAMFGFGGLGLGSAVFGLAMLLLLASWAVERRQARLTRNQRLWTYYALNDRMGHKAHARRHYRPELRKPVDSVRLVCFDTNFGGRRFRSSFGGN